MVKCSRTSTVHQNSTLKMKEETTCMWFHAMLCESQAAVLQSSKQEKCVRETQKCNNYNKSIKKNS